MCVWVCVCVTVYNNLKRTRLTNTISARAIVLNIFVASAFLKSPLSSNRSPKRVQTALEILLCCFKYYSPPHSVSTSERLSRVRIFHIFFTIAARIRHHIHQSIRKRILQTASMYGRHRVFFSPNQIPTHSFAHILSCDYWCSVCVFSNTVLAKKKTQKKTRKKITFFWVATGGNGARRPCTKK